MRIAIASKFFAFGGVTAYGARLAGAFSASGHQVDLIFLRGAPPTGYPLPPGIRVLTYATGLRAELSMMSGMPLMRTVLQDAFSRESSPDLVGWAMTPFWRHWSREYDGVIFTDENYAALNVLATKVSRFPFAVVIHEAGAPNDNPQFGRSRNLMFQAARFLVTPTPKVGDAIRLRYGYSPEIMPITWPVSELRNPRRPIVLLETRWTKDRRPELLLEIMEREHLAHYVMAGSFVSPELFNWFRAEVFKRGLQTRISYHLASPDDSVAEMYATASAYIRWPQQSITGRVEMGVGWGVIRALESGCPCILDRRLGGAFLVQDGRSGYLVDGDAESFAFAISDLLSNDEKLNRFSACAWDHAQKWTVPAQATRVASLVERFQS